tara:strand:- start:348 stop:1115 length:768 start_codon:yes stop_codon:yes gene_type:complete
MVLKYKKIRIIICSLYKDISYIIRRKKNQFFKKDLDQVLCRTCCLGNECIEHLKIKNKIHFQKLRIDGFIKKNKSPFIYEVINFIKNFGITPFITQIQIDPFSIKKYKFIIFDSFSELVDAKFVTPNKKIFYAVKGDVHIEKLKKRGGEYCKHLEIKFLKELYEEVFKRLWFKYNCKIFFILCPTKFDDREYYRNRSLKIKEIIKEIAKEKKYLICIEPKPNKVFKSIEDEFPYHFDSKTVEHISKLLVKEGILR